MLTPIPTRQARIGVFDSGYGGLTILRQIRQMLPQYDYIYLGDNARAPYGSHSFDIIIVTRCKLCKPFLNRVVNL